MTMVTEGPKRTTICWRQQGITIGIPKPPTSSEEVGHKRHAFQENQNLCTLPSVSAFCPQRVKKCSLVSMILYHAQSGNSLGSSTCSPSTREVETKDQDPGVQTPTATQQTRGSLNYRKETILQEDWAMAQLAIYLVCNPEFGSLSIPMKAQQGNGTCKPSAAEWLIIHIISVFCCRAQGQPYVHMHATLEYCNCHLNT